MLFVRRTDVMIAAVAGFGVAISVFADPPVTTEWTKCSQTTTTCGPVPPCYFAGQSCHHCAPLFHMRCQGIWSSSCTFWANKDGACGY